MNMEKGRGEPIKEREEAWKMQSAGTTVPTEKSGLYAKVRVIKVHWHAIHAKKDELLHDGLSEFERQFILECREDGMSDAEIQKWMQEI